MARAAAERLLEGNDVGSLSARQSIALGERMKVVCEDIACGGRPQHQVVAVWICITYRQI